MNKMFLKCVFTLILVLSLNTISRAEMPTVNDIFAKLKQNYDSIKDLQYNIIQEMGMGADKKATIEMKYYLKKPDKVRMEYIKPTESITVINGQNMSTKVTGMDLMKMKTPKDNLLNIEGLAWLIVFKSRNDFNINLNLKDYNSKGLAILIIIPLKESYKNVFSKMLLTIDFEKGVETKTETFDENNKITSITENSDFSKINNIWSAEKTMVSFKSKNKEMFRKRHINPILNISYRDIIM